MKPVDIDKFIEYLKSLGLECTRHGSSHYVFDYPDARSKLDRPLIIRIHKDKQVPLLHMHTNLATLGKSHKDFENWARFPKKTKKTKQTTKVDKSNKPKKNK